MGIMSTSLGRPPVAFPLSGDKQTNTLLLVVSDEMQMVVEDWAKLINSSVMFEPPRARRGILRELAQTLPWPLMATQERTDGELRGTHWAMTRAEDAVKLCASLLDESPAPAAGASTELSESEQDAVRELFNIFCGAADRARCKGIDERVRIKQEWTKKAASEKDLGEFTPKGEGWLVEIDMRVGGHSFRLWQLIHESLGGDTVEYYREEMSSRVTVVCGGKADPPHKPGWRGRVLLVDEAAPIQQAFRYYLEKEGFEIVIASTGDQALKRLTEQAPKAVVLEVMVRDMSGYDICRRIRERYGKSELPVIMCSSRAMREDVILAVQAGATDYIMKPFTRETVLSKLTRALSTR